MRTTDTDRIGGTARREALSLAAKAGCRSVSHLARVADVDREGLALALQGRAELRQATVRKLAAVLGVEADVLERILRGARSGS